MGRAVVAVVLLLPSACLAGEEAPPPDYAEFERGLLASSRRVNDHHLPNRVYSLSEEDAVAYFDRYFAQHPFNNPLKVNLGYAVFHWGRNHRALQRALGRVFLEQLAEVFAAHPSPGSLDKAIRAEPQRHNDLFFRLHFLPGLLGSKHLDAQEKETVRRQLVELSRKAPFLRTVGVPIDVRALPYVNAIRAQYLMTLFSWHKGLGRLDDLGRVLRMAGPRRAIYERFHILVLDNGFFDERQLGSIAAFVGGLPERARLPLVITCHDKLVGEGNRHVSVHSFGCHGRFNLFATRVGRAPGNEFPRGWRAVRTDGFTIVLAHEYGHNVDGAVVSHDKVLHRFRNRVRTMAGADRRNYCRNMFGDRFFVQNPQEFFASLCNQYFACTHSLFDYAMERLRAGNPNPINQFVLVASAFSDDDYCHAYRIAPEGTIRVSRFPVTKSFGLIDSLTIAGKTTRFRYDDGAIVAASAGP